MNKNNDCIFCKIINGEIPSEKVYEDKFCYAFLDIKPITKGHVLIVPKEHSKNIFNISDDSLKHLTPVIKRLANVVREAVNTDGINISMNNEPAAGQAVMHSHIHIIPRFDNDGLPHWPRTEPSKEEREKVAKLIQSFL